MKPQWRTERGSSGRPSQMSNEIQPLGLRDVVDALSEDIDSLRNSFWIAISNLLRGLYA